MNPAAIILGVLCAAEGAFIVCLLYILNRIMEAQKDVRKPVEPIKWEEWEDDR